MQQISRKSQSCFQKEPYVLNLDDIKKMASETVIMLIRSIEAYVEKGYE